jgi:hypothetical protein
MDENYRNFCQNIIDNIKKNGFPEKKVAFPLERMYEVATKRGVNFNKVLETLRSIQIDHQKTPEKIIFFPRAPEPESKPAPAGPFPGMDGASFDMDKMMSMASQMMQNMSPEQLASIQKMYENMSDEDKAALIEQARNMGIFPDKPQ